MDEKCPGEDTSWHVIDTSTCHLLCLLRGMALQMPCKTFLAQVVLPYTRESHAPVTVTRQRGDQGSETSGDLLRAAKP